jgi:FKBP-type peptidyl-prolyl cis-trans isomerase
MIGFRTMLAAAIIIASGSPSIIAAKEQKPETSAEFMKRNARAKQVVVLPGLQYRILAKGDPTGGSPRSSDTVVVHYEGRLPSGTVFDSSYARGEPASLVVRQVIPGWQIALKLMRVGDEWEIFVPAELGYGSKGAGPIPPDSSLIFKIKLIEIKPAETPAR